jgi:hypothetical protein
MSAPRLLSVSAAPSRIFMMGKEIKSRTTCETLKPDLGATLPNASKPVFLPVRSHRAGLETLKGCALSPKERELMQIFGRLPFSFECDWDKRLEPAA